MHSPTRRTGKAFRAAEQGSALFEACLSLLIFLPAWMFIVYIGMAGVGKVQAHQGARDPVLRLQQSWSGCSAGQTLGESSGTTYLDPNGSSGGTSFSVENQTVPAEITAYAAGGLFPGQAEATAWLPCANFPVPPSDSEQPEFNDAIMGL